MLSRTPNGLMMSLLLAIVAGSCGDQQAIVLDDPIDDGGADTCGEPSTDTDADADTDGDVDGDSDGDSDTDSDADNGTCASPIVVGALPYDNDSTTAGRDSSVASYGAGCGELGGTTPDEVYKVHLTAGEQIEIQVEPATGFDAAFAVLGACASGQSCLAAGDAAGEGEVESAYYTAAADETIYVVVEGGLSAESGDYSISITDVNVIPPYKRVQWLCLICG